MSFQQGLSGLNAASKGLDVIGHNIANANTTGMKASRAEFAELYASNLSSAGGGGNGIGVTVAAVSQQFTQGNLSITGNDLDVAINGSGFFKLELSNGDPAYARAGNFKLDDAGNIITNDGAKLQGTITDPITGAVSKGSLSLPTGKGIAGKQTGTGTGLDGKPKGISAELNLDTRTPVASTTVPPTAITTYGTSLDVYDSQGAAIPVGVYFTKTGANTWDVYADFPNDSVAPATSMDTKVGSIIFDVNGKVQEVQDDTGTAIKTRDPATGLFDNPTANLQLKDVHIASGATDKFSFDLNFDRLTQDAKAFTVTDLTQDGQAPGQLTGIKIEADGNILARFSNGASLSAGRIDLVNFRNVQGLDPASGGYWKATTASGPEVVGSPGAGNFGSLRSGALEDSTVDLTQELVSMMTAQRAYQANAQTIKTQDQVMSTLVNLR